MYTHFPYLQLDTLNKSLLHAVQDRVMLDNSKILSLSEELLVGVYARTKKLSWLRSNSHLLSQLIGSWYMHVSVDIVRHVIRPRSLKVIQYIPLSLPSKKLKTGCRPKMQRKYQLMLDIHRGSISFVATPAWSMLLNLMVKGNGSFTSQPVSHTALVGMSALLEGKEQRTNNIATEKSIDPAHDQRVWNDHGHLVLHHSH